MKKWLPFMLMLALCERAVCAKPSAPVAPGFEEMASTSLVERLEYDIRFGFLSVGSAIIETSHSTGGGTNTTARSIQVHNHPWVRLFRHIDDRIECREEEAGGLRRSYVWKQIHEGAFRQDDVLAIGTEAGTAVWSNRLTGETAEYGIPDRVTDYVSLMFDLRSRGGLSPGETNHYRLALDGGVHEMVVSAVATGLIATAQGGTPATLLRVRSLSSGLFVRNVPGSIWVCRDPMVIVAMDVKTKLGTTRAVLNRWERGGKAVKWNAARAGDGQAPDRDGGPAEPAP